MYNKEIINKLLKQKQYHDNMIARYVKYKEFKIDCYFCNTIVNIHNLKQHLKGKNCTEMRNIILLEFPNRLNEFKLKLNELKKNIKYNKLE